MMGNESTPFTMPVVPAGNSGGNGNGLFGGDGAWWIIILFLFCFNGGMWGNGWGGNGGMNGGVGSEVQRGFDHSSVIQKLDGLTNGLCDGFYTVNSNLANGFHGVDNAICNLGYNMQQGFNQTNIALMQGQNALQTQLADCCCTTQRAIDGVRYDMATQACDTRNTIHNATRDIVDNQNANARAILDAMTAQRIEAKDQRIAEQNQQIFQLQLAASQAAQNAVLMASMDANKAEILRRSGHDCPVGAYLVNPPTPVSFYTSCNGYATGFGGGCNPCSANC